MFVPDSPEFAAALEAAAKTFQETGHKATELGHALTEGLDRVQVAAPPEGHIAEEVYERCSCQNSDWIRAVRSGVLEAASCMFCEGTGWWATKRIIRPIPTPDFSEQAALAQLKTKDALLLRAAKTLDYNADILLAAGKTKEAAQTKQAAQAIREAVGEEG